MKIKKKCGGVGTGGGGSGFFGGVQGGCERRIEVFVKIKKKSVWWLCVCVGGGGGSGCGGQGGCE